MKQHVRGGKGKEVQEGRIEKLVVNSGNWKNWKKCGKFSFYVMVDCEIVAYLKNKK